MLWLLASDRLCLGIGLREVRWRSSIFLATFLSLLLACASNWVVPVRQKVCQTSQTTFHSLRFILEMSFFVLIRERSNVVSAYLCCWFHYSLIVWSYLLGSHDTPLEHGGRLSIWIKDLQRCVANRTRFLRLASIPSSNHLLLLCQIILNRVLALITIAHSCLNIAPL